MDDIIIPDKDEGVINAKESIPPKVIEDEEQSPPEKKAKRSYTRSASTLNATFSKASIKVLKKIPTYLNIP